MTEQLTFELAEPPKATFANFVAGRNAEAVDALARIARDGAPDYSLLLWGPPGSGKTHLLKSAVTLAIEGGREARFIDDPSGVGEVSTLEERFVAVDNVERADDMAQGRLFTLYNTLAARGGQLVASASAPPALMRLREDLRTRLGWGLVFEIVPLADADKPEALAAFALARGFRLAPDAMDYLLAHGRRDMASLVQTLTALDRHSLALRRPITVPLIREWLQRELPGSPPPT